MQSVSTKAAKKKQLLTLRRSVAAVIAATRRDHDLTQEQLADKLGWSRWKLAKMENGQGKVEAGELIMIARALGTDPEVVWRRVLRW